MESTGKDCRIMIALQPRAFSDQLIKKCKCDASHRQQAGPKEGRRAEVEVHERLEPWRKCGRAA